MFDYARVMSETEPSAIRSTLDVGSPWHARALPSLRQLVRRWMR